MTTMKTPQEQLEEKLTVYRTLFDLGNTEPNEMQVDEWLQYQQCTKPTTRKDARARVIDKIYVYQRTGLPQLAERLQKCIDYQDKQRRDAESTHNQCYDTMRGHLHYRLSPLLRILSRDATDSARVMVTTAIKDASLIPLLDHAHQDKKGWTYSRANPCCLTQLDKLIDELSDCYKQLIENKHVFYRKDNEMRIISDIKLARALGLHKFGNNPSPQKSHKEAYHELRKLEYDKNKKHSDG